MNTISVNGITLAYSRQGKGAPLVLIHGYPLDGSIWNEVAPVLGMQYDVIVPNLRGFGGSTTVNSTYTISDMADDISGLLDHLGMEKAAFAGHSMGGYVALAFAKKYPKRVSSLALVSSQAVGDPPERKEARYKTAEEVAQKGVGVVVDAMTTKLSADQRVQSLARSLITKQSKEGIIGALKAMAEREDITSSLSSFAFPIVLVHGEADALIPIDRAREIKALVPSASLVELPSVGHLPMMEAPEMTVNTLKLLK